MNLQGNGLASDARRRTSLLSGAGKARALRRNLYLGVAALALVAAGGAFAPKQAMAQTIQTTPANLNVTDIGTLLNNRPRSYDNGGVDVVSSGGQSAGVDIQVKLQLGQNVGGGWLPIVWFPLGAPFDAVGDIDINVGDVDALFSGQEGINATNAAGNIDIVAGDVHSHSTGVNAQVKGFSGVNIAGYNIGSIAGTGNININVGNVTSDHGNGINATTGFGTVDIKAGDVTAEEGFGVNATTSMGLGLGDLTSLLGGGGSGFDPLALVTSGGINIDVGTVLSEGDGINAQVTGESVLGFDVPGIGSINIDANVVRSSQGNGINAQTGIGLIDISAGNVTALNGNGINAETGIGLININVGDVTSDGQAINAHVTGLSGVPVTGDVDGIGLVNMNAKDVISASGGGVDASVGIGAVIVRVDDVESALTGVRASAGTGLVFAMADDVTTAADSAHGIEAVTDGVAIAISTGHVQTEGDGAWGVTVEAGALGDLSALSPFIAQIDDALAGLDVPIATADILDAVEGGVGFAGVNDVTTTGDYALGVHVNAPEGIAGVVATGQVSTEGIDSGAVGAYGEEFAFVVANDVSATGAGSYGIIAQSDSGSALVVADTVVSNGAVGIGAFGGTGFAAVAASDVTTTGDEARGIDAFVSSGDVYVVAGSVTTSGDDSDGIHGWTDDGSTYIIAGDVETRGDNSAGIVNHAHGTSVTVFDTVETFGNNSPAVNTFDGPSDVIVVGLQAITHGNNSAGILAESVDDDVTVLVGEVTTDGVFSLGISALTDAGDVIVGVGSVDTAGDFSDAIDARSQNGDVTVVAGSVTTAGFGSDGITADAGDDALVLIETVTTGGDFAHGILADAAGDATVVVDEVSTSGDFSDGISAFAGEDATVIAGTVSTTGFGSDGITADAGEDAIVVVESVTTAGHFAHGIDAYADIGDAVVVAGTVETAGAFSDGITADAGEDATVVVKSVTTAGFGSDGITAFAGDDALVLAETVTTGGDFAHGILADAAGDATVVVGEVSTSGDFSDGISAFAGEDATVIAGTVSTTGFGSDGITADAGEDAIVVVESVTTAGFGSDGITAFAGDDALVLAETVTTGGDFAHGILADAANGIAIVVAENVSTVGDFSNGIEASSLEGTYVLSGTVTTQGEDSHGIIASASDGSVFVDAGVTEAAQGSAILTFASENAYVRVREAARGEGTVANPVIGGLVGEDYVLLIEEDAVVESTDGDTFDVAVQVAAGDEVVILNQGIINGTMRMASANGNTVFNDLGAQWNWSGFNAFVSGGDNTLINDGVLNAGPFSASLFASTNGDNTITNNNTLNATGFNAFIFSAPNGTSTFNNNSLVKVDGFTNFIGLDDYNNASLTDMQDGDANDAILMTGNFNAIGANSTLAIDAELTPGGTADLLLVGGNVTGVTALNVNDVDNGPGQYDPNGVLFAVVDGTTDVSNFTTNGGIDKGLFRYDAYLKPDTNTVSGENEWYLASNFDREAFELPIIASGAQNLWHASTGTWLDRTADLRSAFGDAAPEIVDLKNEGAVAARPGMVTPGAWLKVFGGTQERDMSNKAHVPSGMVGPSHTYDDVFKQRHYGFMVGLDGGREGRTESNQNEAWIGGIMAGYTGSSLKFEKSKTDVDYKMGSIGAYVTYLNGGFFADAALKADFGQISYSSDLGNGFSDNFKSDFTSVGVILDTGYRINSESGMFFEPKATLAYVHTSYDDGKVLGTGVSFDNGKSVRGRLGARVGTKMDHNGSIVEPWLEGSVWHEFDGDYTAVLSSNGYNAPVSYDLGGTFGEVAGGVNFINMSNGWSGFGKGAVQFGSDNYLGFTGYLGVRKTW